MLLRSRLRPGRATPPSAWECVYEALKLLTLITEASHNEHTECKSYTLLLCHNIDSLSRDFYPNRLTLIIQQSKPYTVTINLKSNDWNGTSSPSGVIRVGGLPWRRGSQAGEESPRAEAWVEVHPPPHQDTSSPFLSFFLLLFVTICRKR